MPLDTLPAKSEMVPVGAIEVSRPLRMPCAEICARRSFGRLRRVTGHAEARGIEEREGAALPRKIDTGAIGGALDRRHPLRRGCGRLIRAIDQAAHGQRIGETGDAEADAALGHGLGALLASSG